MEELPSSTIIKFNPNTLKEVRRDCNLGSPERINQAIDILSEWVKKQPHFKRREYSRVYLELTLMTTKGLVERAKQRIDRLCTFKTLLPRFFETDKLKEEFESIRKYVYQGHLEKLTKSNHRVSFIKVRNCDFDPTVVLKIVKFCISCSEYMRMHEYCSGYLIILDCSEVNALQILTKINVIDFRQGVELVTKAYGMRVKAIHLISPSKVLETMVSFLKQLLTEKLGNRIFAHRSIDALHDHIPLDILPKEWGGKEGSLETISDAWERLLTSDKQMAYLREMFEAKTDESCRQQDKFNENCVGMPGSFRRLCVD